MKKLVFTIALLLLGGFMTVHAQLLNSQPFGFPNGMKEWSDTLYKSLHTKKMTKEGIEPVKLAFRVKFQKHVAKGKWYFVEITNQSPRTKIKFEFSAGPGQDNYSVKLKPGQTEVFEKFNWHVLSFSEKTKPDDQPETWGFQFQEIIAD